MGRVASVADRGNGGTPDAVSINAAQVRELKVQGMGASEIAKALKIGRASVYRMLALGR
jgi:DNA invertase Pin-like site-specific DNA recombinase